MRYDPAVVGPDRSARILTIAVVSGSEWIDVPTTVNTVDNLLVGTLEHFSIYSFRERASGCVTSGNAAYDARMATLGQRLFNLATPPTSSTGCVTEGYLQAGYSEFWPSLENHAGIDFRARTDLTPVYALYSGHVEFQILKFTSTNKIAGQSTLTIRSNVSGQDYRILYLHCESQIQKRIINGSRVVLGALTQGSQILQGDEVCQTGRIGAASSHLHLEVKRVGMDSINPFRALSGSHCPNEFFTNYAGIRTAGCPLSYISQNTIDPVTTLVESSSNVRYLASQEGNPGIPGDNILINGSGPDGFWFFLNYSLINITNGLTLTAFPLPGVNIPDMMIFVSARGLPIDFPCFVGAGAFPVSTVNVRGVTCYSIYVEQILLQNIATFMTQNGCGAVAVSDLVLHYFIPVRVSSLDAVAVGNGRGAIPHDSTPPP